MSNIVGFSTAFLNDATKLTHTSILNYDIDHVNEIIVIFLS